MKSTTHHRVYINHHYKKWHQAISYGFRTVAFSDLRPQTPRNNKNQIFMVFNFQICAMLLYLQNFNDKRNIPHVMNKALDIKRHSLDYDGGIVFK